MFDFERDIEADLKKWKNKKRRKPLLFMGARQVGKTTALHKFGKAEFNDTAYFNFEEKKELCELFIQTKNPENGKTIDPEKTLVIFDEIQECGDALTSLKYFCENAPEYHIIGAGSLLGVSLGRVRSFPVGKVDFLYLHPLKFGEFLKISDKKTWDVYEHYAKLSGIVPLPKLFYQQILRQFKQYLIVGGMPEVAATWLETSDLSEVKNVASDILNAYSLDFVKHAPSSSDIAKIQYVWQSLPSQLAKENKKFIYKTIKQGARAREYEVAIMWLEQAGLIYKVNKTEKPVVPIKAYDDISSFKLYTLDVGLLATLAGYESKDRALGDSIYSEFQGSFTENYICQAISARLNVKPRYWTSGRTAEVDFIIQHGGRIIPVEVKSGNNVQSKSLRVYAEKYKPELKLRFSLKNLQYEKGLLNLPIFYADYFTEFIEKI